MWPQIVYPELYWQDINMNLIPLYGGLRDLIGGMGSATGVKLSKRGRIKFEAKDFNKFFTKKKKVVHKKKPVQIRKNFQETAFFYPNLRTDEQGKIEIAFTIPESLTKWKMMGIAHTKDLKIGKITRSLITQKKLMVNTNPPRFLREKDTIVFSSKINNLDNSNIFKGGWLAHRKDVAYHPGGWPQDWENVYAYTLYAYKKLILKDKATAAIYGFSEEEYNENSIRSAHAFLKNLSAGGLIKDEDDSTKGLKLTAQPYNLPDFDMAWGYNRYNLGMSITGYLFYDAYKGQEYEVTTGLNQTNQYKSQLGTNINFNGWGYLEEQAVRHLDYILGLNPWDVSFVMGVGAKNLNHPHNRTASSEASNGSAQRYDYTVPIGALMGGQSPGSFASKDGNGDATTAGGLTLKEDVLDYVVDETCVDYSMVLMAMTAMNAEVLPPDTLAPKIFNQCF